MINHILLFFTTDLEHIITRIRFRLLGQTILSRDFCPSCSRCCAGSSIRLSSIFGINWSNSASQREQQHRKSHTASEILRRSIENQVLYSKKKTLFSYPVRMVGANIISRSHFLACLLLHHLMTAHDILKT